MRDARPTGAMSRRAALAVLAGAAATVAGCASGPRSGPLASNFASEGGEDGAVNGLVAPLTAAAAAAAATAPGPGFSGPLRLARPIDVERIGVGDHLDITVWEPSDAPLLGGGGGFAQLADIEVGSDGAIRTPYAGVVKAAGATTSEVAARLRRAFSAVAVTPEVNVSLRDPRSRLITVQGVVARPGVYPIERATARLLPMLAVAGGATIPPEQVEVSLRRDGAAHAETLSDLYADPGLDVALRPGDAIVLSAVRKRFIALGASTLQTEVAFPTRDLDLLRALAAVRGLRDFDANPSVVFVLRYERPKIADALLAGPRPPALPDGPMRPIAYQLDMTSPAALFVAQRFAMRDGDAILATNAPLSELRKFIQIFSSVLTPVQQTSVIAQ